MGRKYKYSPEDKIQVAKDYILGYRRAYQICMDLGIKYNRNRGGVVRTWAKLHEEFGKSVFFVIVPIHPK